MATLPRKSVDSTVRANLDSAQGTVQLQSHNTFNREPLAAEIPDQGFVLAIVSGTPRLYTRIGTQRYRVNLTAV